MSTTILTRSFWPVAEAAQSDYESLRSHVLTVGALPDSSAAVRFSRRGLAGLITWPTSEPVFRADLVAASRPKWTPYADPRVDALAAGFALLLDLADTVAHETTLIDLQRAG